MKAILYMFNVEPVEIMLDSPPPDTLYAVIEDYDSQGPYCYEARFLRNKTVPASDEVQIYHAWATMRTALRSPRYDD